MGVVYARYELLEDEHCDHAYLLPREKLRLFRENHAWYPNETNEGKALIPKENHYLGAVVYKMMVQPKKENLNTGQA